MEQISGVKIDALATTTSINALLKIASLKHWLQEAEKIYDTELAHVTDLQLQLDKSEEKLLKLSKTITKFKSLLKSKCHKNQKE